MSHYTAAATALALNAASTAHAMHPDAHFPELIVGGTPAKQNEYKFYTAYSKAGTVTPFCGGSLIAKTWALTAAHCNLGGAASDYQVRVNAFELSKDSEGEEIRVLKQVITAPDWNPQTIQNDYGLLNWEKEVDFAEAQLFNSNVFANDPKPLTLVGLGRDKGGSSPSRPAQLQQTDMDFVTDAKCGQEWGSNFNPDNMICAEFPTASACNGDSGGPLFFQENGVRKQIGVVSWGQAGCAVDGRPNVYARLTPQVLEYIELTIES